MAATTKLPKMPRELQRICSLISTAKLEYNLFKCEHIVEGANKNLDLLFLSNSDYQNASAILEKEGYLLYMDESVEKYKKMYVKVDKVNTILTAVHLHREIAWHGVPVLDKKKVFAGSKNNFPSSEDALLIHSAHALFENFKVSAFQKELLQKYSKESKDYAYVDQHLSAFGWKKAFHQFIINHYSVKKGMILSAYLGRFFRDPSLIASPLQKAGRRIWRSISLKRRGTLIAISGVNGSGKTTLVNQVLHNYQSITKFFHGQQGYYYGWDPFLPLTKILSRTAKNNNIYQKLNQKGLDHKADWKKEAILLYDCIEYLARYYAHIYPSLRQGKLVVTDRYCYDMYAQHSYAEKSRIMKILLPLFPKPDYFFVLHADIATIMNRDKNTKVLSNSIIKSAERNVHEPQELEDQIRRYQELQNRYAGIPIETTKAISENTTQIIQKSWPSLIR